jgi:Cu2+-exporting ATPase
MKIGVMVKDGSALERLAVVDRVLLDKTGTTTLARFAVVGGMPHDRVALGLLLALAQPSRHPLSRAVSDAAIEAGAQPAAVQDLVEHAGLGIEGKFDGVACRLGRADWVSGQPHPDQDLVEVAFRFGQAPLVHILLEDQLRPDAAQAFDRMQALALSPELVSGDSVTVVGRLAAELRVAGVARMSPADKHQRIVELEAAGHHVLMVGDGLNDGPALKAASVAMAPGTATDVGTLAADIVFLGERLMPVPLTIVVARRTMAVVRQNFVLAIAYNALAVPLAIAGLVTPLIAALAMSGSSLLVMINALRARRAAAEKA